MIYHRQNYRFEMIAPCPFDMMVANLFEMTMALFEMMDWPSFRNDDGYLFEMMDGLSLRDDL